MKFDKMIILTGIVVGVFAVLLTKLGNPPNMGFCVACFIRDIAGALGLHRVETVQYIRPEIPGIILGAFLISLVRKEFGVRGGSATLSRFLVGFFVMIGALVFLGCPLRMVLRFAAGDLNAIIGLLGFSGGILTGLYFLKKGFTFGKSQPLAKINGYVLPIISSVLIIFAVTAPVFIFFSEKGPASMRAPFIISLIVGLMVGALAQRSRLCLAGGIRDVFLIKNFHLISGFLAIFVTVLILNIILGNFKLSFVDQPIAHTESIWNFLGMFLVGYGSMLLGGCPLRQCVLTGMGDTDAGITFLGMLAGAALAHNLGLSASAMGVGINGKVAVVIGVILFTMLAYFNSSEFSAKK